MRKKFCLAVILRALCSSRSHWSESEFVTSSIVPRQGDSDARKGLRMTVIAAVLCAAMSIMFANNAWARYGTGPGDKPCPEGYTAQQGGFRCVAKDSLVKEGKPAILWWSDTEEGKAEAAAKEKAEASKGCSSVTCGAGEVLNPADCSCVKTKNDTASEILDKYSVKNTAPQKFDSVYDSVDKSGNNKTDGSGESGGGNSAGGQSGGTEGSTTSGYVSNVEDVAQGIDNDFGMGICKEGSIFKQLACRAGYIGDGLRKVAYIIAGLALIVFSFAAIFGKVKWPVFCTIVFCCFLLSVVVFVVNTMTAKENSAAWIGGINDDGSVVSYQSTNEEMAANQNVDASGKQFSDEERPQ